MKPDEKPEIDRTSHKAITRRRRRYRGARFGRVGHEALSPTDPRARENEKKP
jgi:hypothetical protein